MSRREERGERGEYPPPPPSKCAKVLYYTWKLCSVVFSHFVMISLVVAYCILGAVTFERLEAQHEREVKMNISQIRSNTTQSIWTMTRTVPLLNQTNWTCEVVDMLKDFENAILLEMKVRGWDGNESTDSIQWTFTGALFYSIIVITTIGYGHIAPKTQTGKVVTIFYAILGIPLMLLCLSNIGDVMASSFRFLYWRVCCYVCTRPPKRRHRHHPSSRRSVRGGSVRGSTRRRPRPIERAHSDTDCRYRDSGYSSGRVRKSRPPALAAGHTASLPRTRPQPPVHARIERPYGPRDFDPEEHSPVRYERYDRERPRDTYEEEDEDFPKISLPLQDLEAALKDLEDHQMKISKPELRSKSLPRPAKAKPEYGPRRDFDDQRHFDDEPKDMYEMHDLHDVDYENYKERKALERERRREREDMYGMRDRGYDPEDEDFEFDYPRGRRPRRDWRSERGRSEYYERDRDHEEPFERRQRRARSAIYDYEQRWVDERPPPPHSRPLRRLHTVDDTRPQYRHSPSIDRDDWSDEVAVVPRRSRPPQAWSSRQSDIYHPPSDVVAKEQIKPVPIWLCVFLVASYIVAGTFLFKRWESWSYLDAAYFCFITLTTIGFGDFVPAQGRRKEDSPRDTREDAAAAVHSIALCSLYLLFGIALLAMSFNLVQEEVRANVAALATKLGIIKPRDTHQESDTDY
ncbi:potassium two pore domain channel subfamily K member galene isoform X3 [Anticarsia gemmatalis]|uniref:potassium two pore domain channel subfamily K member galene isoform X3 n=1 Tax=Anticarsia gemmatalis TaxID=129554 RepID=UPI003F774ECA